MTDNGSRREIAAMVMQSMLAHPTLKAGVPFEDLAGAAVEAADALLAALAEDSAVGDEPRESRVRGHVVVEIGKMSTSILPADTLYLSSGKIVLAGPNHVARAKTLARAIRVACGGGGA